MRYFLQMAVDLKRLGAAERERRIEALPEQARGPVRAFLAPKRKRKRPQSPKAEARSAFGPAGRD